MDWQPIEAAPEEGERVLVFVKHGIYTAKFVSGKFCFIDADQGIYSEFFGDKPTHWMALPEPPKKEHYCTNKTKDWICRTNSNESGSLILIDYRGIWSKVLVCPFCG